MPRPSQKTSNGTTEEEVSDISLRTICRIGEYDPASTSSLFPFRHRTFPIVGGVNKANCASLHSRPPSLSDQTRPHKQQALD